MPKSIYPWQTSQWQRLTELKQQNRLPHALLLKGAAGLGKRFFALEFARFLLCREQNAPCHQCHGCHLFAAGSHPDFMLLEPEQSGGAIKIDQIREMVQFVSETAMQSGFRVIIVNPAHAMNVYSANALLKTLEEPAPNTIIILISDQSARLPATLLSRCQKIFFQKPTIHESSAWLNENSEILQAELLLNLAQGAPLKAKEFSETDLLATRKTLYDGLHLLKDQKMDPITLAAKLQECDPKVFFELLFMWLQDMLRFNATRDKNHLTNSDYEGVFSQLVHKISTQQLFHFLDHVKKIYSHVLTGLNLNRLLMLEELLMRWVQL